MSLHQCFNIADVRRAAKKRLPAPLFHYIDGGADDEWTLARNSSAFSDYQFSPRALCDVSKIELGTDFLGMQLAMPLFLAPTGMSRLFHHDKEIAAARAAERFGTLYSLSTLGTTSLEQVAAAISTPKMFQVYILKDRELTLDHLRRCKVAGYKAICLTIDMAMAGNRERDRRTGMVMPPRFGLKSLASFASRPHWTFHFLRSPHFDLANVSHRIDALGQGAMGLIDYVNSQFDRSVTWHDVEWLRAHWDGPLLLKGVLNLEDALQAQRIGINGLMVSNHGGRQLDGVPAPVDLVRPIRESCGEGLSLVVDGGIRRGSDVIKALALGANACSIGKAYLYGLGAAGQRGVEHVLRILLEEMTRTMTLLGCNSVTQLKPNHVSNNRVGFSKN